MMKRLIQPGFENFSVKQSALLPDSMAVRGLLTETLESPPRGHLATQARQTLGWVGICKAYCLNWMVRYVRWFNDSTKQQMANKMQKK